MRLFIRTLVLASVLLVTAASVIAQTEVDPSGHWEGMIQAPGMDVKVAIDLAKNNKGQLAGTFDQPGENLRGLPFTTVAVEGRSLRLLLRAGSGGGTFNGTLAADGKSIAGEFIMNEGGHAIPFSLTRTGDAVIAAAPKSAPIGKELEGTWNGTLEAGGRQMRIVLTMANQPDGSAAGTIVSQDGSGVEIPIAITQKTSSVTIDVKQVGASYVGVVNATGTEVVGTWTQGPSVLPLTFRRAAK